MKLLMQARRERICRVEMLCPRVACGVTIKNPSDLMMYLRRKHDKPRDVGTDLITFFPLPGQIRLELMNASGEYCQHPGCKHPTKSGP
jgi:hypothetical protein